MRRRKPALAFIFILLVLDILGIGLIVPILPKLVRQLSGGDAAEGALTYGVVLGIYALMQFVFAPIIGALSDRYGRRPVILISLLGAGIDYFIMAWAPTLAWFFVGRIIAGITAANFSAATAYIADISPPEKRAANFGLVGAAFGLGFAIGPALGGLISEFGTRTMGEDLGIRLPFIVAGILTLLNWLYGLCILPESLKPENRRVFKLSQANPFSAIVALRRYPLVLGLAIAYFLLALGHQVYPAIWALYTKEKFAWSEKDIGYSLAAVGIMALIVQGGLARRLIPWLGERLSAIAGTALEVAMMVAFGLATNAMTLYALIVVGALGGICTPAIQGLISRTVGDDEQGSIQGSLTSLQSVAGFLGPIMITATYSYYISDQVVTKVYGAGFFFAAGLTLLGLLVMIWCFCRVNANTTG